MEKVKKSIIFTLVLLFVWVVWILGLIFQVVRRKWSVSFPLFISVLIDFVQGAIYLPFTRIFIAS